MTRFSGTEARGEACELKPLELPLHGSRLIEASAGTGKTYTIAALYLRLVLGHGALPEGCGALTPPQILVMTFTEAATQELRERIRDGLATAARVFRAEDPDQVGGAEPIHLDLRAQWPDARERAGAARRLEVAAEWMDESAVSTIHSWCQRVLREHAFASGSPFRQELAADQRELLAEAARDFWRRFVYPQAVDGLELLRGAWGGDPAALLGKVRPLLGRVEPLPPATEALTTPAGLNAWLAGRLRRLAAMKERWNEDRDAVEEQFRRLHREVLNGNKYKNPESLLEAMREWADTPGLQHPRIGGSTPLLERMSATGMAQEGFCKKGKTLPADLHPAFAALDDHAEVCADQSERLLKAAAAAIDRRFRRAQRQRAQMGFNDLLTRLRDALEGTEGEALARTLRERFPVALIDEFQDTDPDQYRIFERIYRIQDNPAATGLLLIGDPKQAIYRFRGADIHSYLRARRATAGRHYTLPRNFRSVASLVAGVNHLFARAEGWPDGAFGFAGGELPFHRVKARGRGESLTENRGAVPALTLWRAGGDEPVGIGEWRATAAAACASRMVELLNGGVDGATGFRRADAGPGAADLEPLRPRDMAVLVRDRKEAAEIERALRERGVRSVYLSGGDSVYTAAEAGDLLRWLRACAEPTSERLLRAALATPTLGLPLAELHRLTLDELRWEARVEQFRAYRRLWQGRGVLPMLRALLHDFDVPRTLLAREGGERAVTNLLHLSELLQEADAELDGEQALIRHLTEHRDAGAVAGDEQILRLESDEDLVKVVTLHKSKGLEYPLVFLPFVCGFREVTSKDVPFLDRAPGSAPQWRFHMDDAAKERQQREQRAEDLRLLYVGMTRARHACWMAIAPIRYGKRNNNDLHRTAVGYLLFGPEGVEPAALAGRMEDLRDGAGHVRVEPLPPPAAERCRAGDAAPATGPARV
ncbi:MAG: exodeoxyribonuclease V subunit beta, partial [Thioalkalivibrio sp.]|nr:exodeoxyribonuclease V subunit beta [Thioalkalivibrio sp.]